MERLPSMVDMRLSDEDKAEMLSPFPSTSDMPDYPPGLCICLCDKELDKLGLDKEPLEYGDMIHLHAMAIVRSTSTNQSGCRVELALAFISAEDEEEEDEVEEKKDPIKKLYKDH